MDDKDNMNCDPEVKIIFRDRTKYNLTAHSQICYIFNVVIK